MGFILCMVHLLYYVGMCLLGNKVMMAYCVYYGSLIKRVVQAVSGHHVLYGTTINLNSGLLNLKYHRITSETTLVIRNVQKYVSFLKKITLYADNRYGKMHLCLFAAKRCCYP